MRTLGGILFSRLSGSPAPQRRRACRSRHEAVSNADSPPLAAVHVVLYAVRSGEARSPDSSFRDSAMRSQFTLEYWRDGEFYVGRLLEVPGVFSQGETLEELRDNIQDAYDLMVTQERSPAPASACQQPVELNV